jgi:hypothetical protein
MATSRGTIGWVALIRAFTPVFAGSAKPIIAASWPSHSWRAVGPVIRREFTVVAKEARWRLPYTHTGGAGNPQNSALSS